MNEYFTSYQTWFDENTLVDENILIKPCTPYGIRTILFQHQIIYINYLQKEKGSYLCKFGQMV